MCFFFFFLGPKPCQLFVFRNQAHVYLPVLLLVCEYSALWALQAPYLHSAEQTLLENGFNKLGPAAAQSVQ